MSRVCQTKPGKVGDFIHFVAVLSLLLFQKGKEDKDLDASINNQQRQSFHCQKVRVTRFRQSITLQRQDIQNESQPS